MFKTQQPYEDAPPCGGVAQAAEPVGEGFVSYLVAVYDDSLGIVSIGHERAFYSNYSNANYSLQ